MARRTARAMFYALLHIFGPEVTDRKGRPICEVYLFETSEDRTEWVGEEPSLREAVDLDHPVMQSLLGESPVFELATPWEPVAVREEALR